MIDTKLEDFGLIETYKMIEEHCSYNDEAYKIMRGNMCNGNDKGIPGMIFSSSW